MKRSFLNWTRLCAIAVCAFFALATLAGCSAGSEAENDEYDFSDWETGDNYDDWNPGKGDNSDSGTCTLYFYPNAPAGTPEAESLEPKTVTVNTGSYYTLPEEPAFSVEGYYFLGWAYIQPPYNNGAYLSPGYELYVPNGYQSYSLWAIWGTSIYINGLRISKNVVVGYVKDELPADVVIPDGVTAIGWRAFYDAWECVGCDIIKSITIPASVQSIGEYAFWNCSNLEKVVIKGQPSEIGISTFDGCTSLKSIELPDSVKSIGKYAFEGCKSLESVTMNGVETIESYAFSGCKNLASVAMNSVEYIKESAFSNCGLTSVHLPNTLKFIGDSAFFRCNFESVVIPDSVSVENIEKRAFHECKRLKKAVLPDGWNEINFGLFKGCESLEDVNFPSALKTIGEQAFSGCSSLKEVVITDGVTEIKRHAFSRCKKLAKVKIPDSVKIIGEEAFWRSPLSEIIIPDNATVEKSAFSVSTNLRTISLPASLINAGVKFWDIFTTWISALSSDNDCPELIIPIINDKFSDCRSIDIILRDGATRIPKDFSDDNNYYRPYKFKSIKIPDGVKTIEEYALSAAKFDSDIELPDSITVIERYALAGVPIKRLPSKLEYIGEDALRGYPNESITIPGSVKFFGEFAFYNSNLKSVTIERGVTEVPGGAFAAYNSNVPGDLEKIEIPDTVTKIGPSAFFYQPNLKDIKIPDSVKSIEYDAFVGCSSLNASVTGKWYRVKKNDETNKVDPADPSGKNLYYYSDWNWYRK